LLTSVDVKPELQAFNRDNLLPEANLAIVTHIHSFSTALAGPIQVLTMTSTIGIPIKLLNEAQGHIVTLEITSGQTYRGKLLEGWDIIC
jgi:hypothetical protein